MNPAAALTWTKMVGVTANGNSITKTAVTGWGNGGASSLQTISGDGYIDFGGTQTNTYRMIGLSNSDVNANYNTIKYAIYLGYGYFYVYENGVNRGRFSTYTTSDRFQVERQGTVIRYKKNGAVFYTSTIASSGSLVVDTALYTKGAVVSDVRLFAGP